MMKSLKRARRIVRRALLGALPALGLVSGCGDPPDPTVHNCSFAVGADLCPPGTIPSAVTGCPDGGQCVSDNQGCTFECRSSCAPEGQTQCAGATLVQRCENGQWVKADDCSERNTICKPSAGGGAGCENCPVGQSRCGDGQCHDFTMEQSHCGGCDQACSTNDPHGSMQCVSSQCKLVCDESFDLCAGTCVPGLETNDEHCGTCDRACTTSNGTNHCVEGQCKPECDTTHGNCDGNDENGCETDLHTSGQSCGACNNDCASKPHVVASAVSCSGGTCLIPTEACTAPFADCDKNPDNGCEVDTFSDVHRCGGCSALNDCALLPHASPSAVQCDLGHCVIGNCDGGGWEVCTENGTTVCKDTDNDVANCGGCGEPCAPPLACQEAECSDGNCLVTTKPGYCVIAGVCHAQGDVNPANVCEQCAAQSSSQWSPVVLSTCTHGACKDENHTACTCEQDYFNPDAAKQTCVPIFGKGTNDVTVTGQQAIQVLSTSVVTSSTISQTATSIPVESGAAFQAGDYVLIIDLQGAGSPGSFTTKVVAQAQSGTLSFGTPIGKTFAAGDKVVVHRFEQYHNLTVAASGVLQPSLAWNGKSGGVLPLLVSGMLTVQGQISVNGLGFRGALAAQHACSTPGYVCARSSSGEGSRGEGGDFAYGGGQGGSCEYYCNPCGGGGGGNATPGGAGSCHFPGDAHFGSGGAGWASGSLLAFGGGGGGGSLMDGAVYTWNEPGSHLPGARGGGIVVIQAFQIAPLTGSLSARGADGPPLPGGFPCPAKSGGAGAGGTIGLFTRTQMTVFDPLGTKIIVAGGAAGNGSGAGGQGSVLVSLPNMH